jgi:hypothetical protein
MLTVMSFALGNAHVRAYSSACWEVDVSVSACVVLFGCPSTVTYPTLARVVVEAFVELPSINQVGASGMEVSRM